MWRGLLVGLAVGFAAGWLAFRRPATDDGRRSEPVGAAGRPEPAAKPTLSAVGPGTDETPTEPPSDIAGAKEPPLAVEPPVRPDAAALLAAAQKALRDRDGEALGTALRMLARAEGDDVDAFLVDVMRDTTLPMPGPMGSAFLRALKDSRMPRVAEAARMRFDAEMALGRDHWWGADGWLDLVALHGGAEDIAWLRAIAADRKTATQVRIQAIEALAASPHPDAPAAFEATVDSWSEAALATYLGADPERAVRFVERRLDGEVPSHMDRRSLWQAYARHAPRERLQDLERRILTAEGIAAKADALYAMETLSERGHDLTALGGVIPALLAWLSANADDRGTQTQGLLREVLYAFEHNRVTWRREALGVLERVAPDARATKEIRAHLASSGK